MTLDICPATIRDADGILKCVTESYQHYTKRIGKAPGPMKDDYKNRIENDHVFVVKSGKIIAGVLVFIITPQRCLLDNVAVLPNFSGQEIGKKLVIFAETRAADLGFNKIELYTHELMTENINMYRKWGYKITKHIEEKGFNRVYMSKQIPG